MYYLYLLGCIICIASSSIFSALFNRKNIFRGNTSNIYAFVNVVAVQLGWIILYILDWSFDSGVLLYALAFGACYTAANIGIINAIRYGSISLSSLFQQLSLVAVAVWGFFFWDTKFGIITAIGLILVIVSLCLCLLNGGGNSGFSFKWIIYVALSFFGNAGCSIITKTQQMKYNGQYGAQFMAFASLFSLVICLSMFLRTNTHNFFEVMKYSWYLPVIAGVLNVLLNLFIMRLAVSPLSPALIYPAISVGGILVVSLTSALAFKEKMSRRQWIGVGVGAVAVALLSL